jgi:hypothetical protein
MEHHANDTVIYRRETRQSCCKVRQPERFEQDVLHPGEEAELLLYRHVNSGKTTGSIRYERIGTVFAREHLRGVFGTLV